MPLLNAFFKIRRNAYPALSSDSASIHSQGGLAVITPKVEILYSILQVFIMNGPVTCLFRI
ncbi:MAG: hypothetical protein H6Q92_1497 [Nitrospirae bacterium]|nr:hypothetical protein [Nitrospirota bacterium]